MQKTFETTIEKMNRAVEQLQHCGYSRSQAIDRLVYELEEGGATIMAEFAKKNLS